jgi:hypothetical protein
MAPNSTSLDKVDPKDAWQPWQPTRAEPWGRKWAAHLYRRAGFGASRAELVESVRLGPEGALNQLLNGPAADELSLTLADVGRIAADHDDGGQKLRGWWLYCMLHGNPLLEKLTLFWHNHFATSIFKVKSVQLMFRQNLLLRRRALGKFEPFLQAMSKDGAMLVWLDSNSNVKASPNENYARELMELFSLGVGNYTEKDVREAARAFTGWHTDGVGFRFDASVHDGGKKTVLAKTGDWDGSDVVRIVLEQPAAARFLVRKFYQHFVSENAVPPDGLLEPLCQTFRKSDYDIAALSKTILASRHFYSEHAFRQRVKSPVEYALGAVRAVYRLFPESAADYRPLPQQALVRRIAGMGQQLFAPPNVKGWVGGRSWLNTSTLLERSNFASELAMGTIWTPAGTRDSATPPKALDPARILGEEEWKTPEDIVRVLLDLYVPGGARSDAEARLVAFIAHGKPAGAELERRVREAVHAILTMAEYHLA